MSLFLLLIAAPSISQPHPANCLYRGQIRFISAALVHLKPVRETPVNNQHQYILNAVEKILRHKVDFQDI